MATAFGLPEIASLYDPNIAVDQVALQRRMAIAQALRQQAMTPLDTSGRQIGGMGYKISPWEGVAKAVQAVMAGQQDTANDQDRLALQQKMAQALLGQQAPQGQPAPQQAPAPVSSAGAPSSPLPQGQPTAQPAQGPAIGGIGIGDLFKGGVVNDIGGPAMAAAYAKNFEPTDFARALRSAGIDPNSALGHQLAQDNIAKGNYIPPVSGRPGGYLEDPKTGRITSLPNTPPGYVATQDPNSPTGFTTQPQPGGPAAVQGAAKAKAIGEAFGDVQPTVDRSGQPQPVQSRAKALGYGDDGNVAPATQTARDAQSRQLLADELRKWQAAPDSSAKVANIKDIQTQMGGLTDQPSASYVAPPLGTSEAQISLDKKWESQLAANKEAMTTSSYLDNIVSAAHKGAIVGPGADRRELVQGFLQLAGINENVNSDAVTQTQLLDKYHNQIVARLGQGGLGTDAARAILDTAYPGKPMNIGAIDEAAANLKGAQAMTQARTRFLQPAASKRDQNDYANREIQFDQAADPRIWQFKNLQDPAARSAFAKQVLSQDPSFPARIKQLESMGAL